MYSKLRTSLRDCKSLTCTVLCRSTAWTRPQEPKNNQWPTTSSLSSDTSYDWELTFRDSSSNFHRKSFQKNFTWLTLVNRFKLSGSRGLFTWKSVPYLLHFYCGSGSPKYFFGGGTKARYKWTDWWKNKLHGNFSLWGYKVEQDNSLKGEMGT